MSKIDLQFLNFKQILVVLTSSEMRLDVIDLLRDQDVDAGVKFVNSYYEAASLIQEQQHDPFDHVIMKLSVNNRKAKDFLEFVDPSVEKDNKFLINYTSDGELELTK